MGVENACMQQRMNQEVEESDATSNREDEGEGESRGGGDSMQCCFDEWSRLDGNSCKQRSSG